MNEDGRSPEFERDFLENAARQAGAWTQSLPYQHLGDELTKRDRKGLEEYGPGSFLDKDLSREIAEEALDVILWAKLDALKALAEGDMERVEARLRQAAGGMNIWFIERELRERTKVPA